MIAGHPVAVGFGSGRPLEVLVAFVGVGCGGLEDVILVFVGGYAGEPEMVAIEDEIGIEAEGLELRPYVKVVRLSIVGIVNIIPLAVVGKLLDVPVIMLDESVFGATVEPVFGTKVLFNDGMTVPDTALLVGILMGQDTVLYSEGGPVGTSEEALLIGLTVPVEVLMVMIVLIVVKGVLVE